MNALRIIPEGGLANRMRALDSACQLAIDADRPLIINWIQRYDFKAEFNALFEMDWFHRVEKTRGVLPEYQSDISTSEGYVIDQNRGEVYINYLNLQNILHKKVSLLHLLRRFENFDVTIRSFSRFYGQNNYKVFYPVSPLMKKISEYTITSDTIGIHIRRGDHKISTNKSPLYLFEESILNILKSNKSQLFYLASDDEATKKTLQRKFPKNIITDIYSHERSEVQSIQTALIEMFLLSSTKRILGSYSSSFSQCASHLGGVPLTILSNSKL